MRERAHFGSKAIKLRAVELAEGSDLVLTTTLKISPQPLPGNTMTSHAITHCSKLVCNSRDTYRLQYRDCGAQVASNHILQKPKHPIHHDLSVAIDQQDNEMKRIGQVGKVGLVAN